MAQAGFITFEGGEGAGKSTQIKLLGAAFQAKGHAVLQTREPGGSPGAEQIRGLLVDGPAERWQPLTEALLHYAARVEHLNATVRPALAEGTWVLCDRFTDSTLAYQGYGHQLGAAPIETLRSLVAAAPLPDLTLILDLPVEIGLTRAVGRADAEARYERMGRDFHERVRQGFLEIARDAPDRCAVIDADAAPEEVQCSILETVERRLGLALA